MERLTKERFYAVHEHQTNTHITALILGATGKTGRRVVARLNSVRAQRPLPARGAPPSRSTGTHRFENLGRATARRRRRLFYTIVYAPDVSMPGADDQVGALAKLARQNARRSSPRAAIRPRRQLGGRPHFFLGVERPLPRSPTLSTYR